VSALRASIRHSAALRGSFKLIADHVNLCSRQVTNKKDRPNRRLNGALGCGQIREISMSYGLAIGLDVSASDDDSKALKLKTILTDIDPEIAEKAKDIGRVKCCFQ
jgi:hypothetical protein